MICFDPCTKYPTHSCLVVRKHDLLQKLEENALNIFWTVLGEKMIIGGNMSRKDYEGRLNISGIVSFDKDGQLKHFPHYVEE